MSIRQGLATYYKLFGVRGILSISAYRLLGVPKEIVIQPAGARHPIHLRLRTSDVSVYKDILLTGEYDVQLAKPPHTIVDAGANAGMAAIYYANKYPDARIVAVEPEPSNYAALLKNVAPYTNVIPVNAALWNKNCQIRLGSPQNDSRPYSKWAFQVSNQGIPVRGITMRTLMEETGLDNIDLLKMDIEGGEVEAFANCDWIDGVQAIAIELHDHIRPGCRAVLKEVTKEFRSWDRGEMTFCLREHRAEFGAHDDDRAQVTPDIGAT
jgi:FkbM family methyltransferase